jgi:catechol 2,3-dioxygenase-like lactoylglutathione lyase family enzyme
MINAYQHAGIGVRDAGVTYKFYKDLLGFKVKANDATCYRKEMESVVGALVEMRIIMAANAMGGGVIELCEHTSTKPLEPPEEVRWGDLGFFELGIKAYDLNSLFLNLKNRGVSFLTPVRSMELTNGEMLRYAYLKDPDGLLIQLVEVEKNAKPRAGGVHHVGLGVKDLEAMRRFYSEVLGYTEVEHEFKGHLPELDEVTGGEEMELVMLQRPGAAHGSIPNLDSGRLKLVHTLKYQGRPIFQDRRWGDIGMMELAFDVDQLAQTVNGLLAAGAAPYLSPTCIDMGSGSAGSVAYVLDPEGNCIELVETLKAFWMKPAMLNRVLTPLLKLGLRLGIL